MPPESPTPQLRVPSPIVRGLAALFGIGLVLVALLGCLVTCLALITAARPPDPFGTSGFFAGPPPKDWNGAVRALVALAVVIAIEVGVWMAAGGLLLWAAGARWPRPRFILGGPIVAAVLGVLVVGSALVAQRGDAVTAPDCSTFTFHQAAFRRGLVAVQRRQALGVTHCGVARRGDARAAVDRALGAPDGVDDTGIGIMSSRGQSTELLAHYGLVDVSFDEGRAVDITLHAPPTDD